MLRVSRPDHPVPPLGGEHEPAFSDPLQSPAVTRCLRCPSFLTAGAQTKAVSRTVCVHLVERVQQQRLACRHRYLVATPDRALSDRFGHPPIEIGRQHLVERLAQQRGQGRRPAARRHRNRDAVATDRSAQKRAGVGGVVHGVDENPPRFRRGGYLAVDFRRRRRDDEPGAVEVGGRNARRAIHPPPRFPA